jgi:hypothetical protein
VHTEAGNNGTDDRYQIVVVHPAAAADDRTNVLMLDRATGDTWQLMPAIVRGQPPFWYSIYRQPRTPMKDQ